MPKSYRFKTDVGKDKEVRIKIDQDFDFLEILSLKLRQDDVYERFCADFGVVAGRVVANGGFGVPNVKVSIFVPLDNIDENDPIISTLYPYKTITQKNEDGYRYNLLPYEKEYGGHTPTGTFPSREDLLTRKEVLEVYDKYYKFTVNTNNSGDFMIVGAPLGSQQLFFDLDLSNIGEFSLRPADLIRMGMGVPSQFNGDQFKASEDLNSLPQIVSEVKQIEVNPFWGQNDLCDVGISRVDLDLRDLGIEITPHSVFMGSIFSTTEDDYLKVTCRPKPKTGSFCDTIAGPGIILSIRQTIDIDVSGNPILEQYVLEDGGNIIDENGAWLTELPMNLNYVTTDEFGQQVISNDPALGIPTKSKYRFKVKWQDDGGGAKGDIKRAHYLIPNIKERGWVVYGDGAVAIPSEEIRNKSYAFSLNWDDYYDPQSAIDCLDTFYEFNYNKVYTIASHIDRWKFGRGRKRHLGIKEINDRTCQSENNKLPINEVIRNSNLLITLFNLLIIPILTNLLIAIIPAIHVLVILYPVVRLIINTLNYILTVPFFIVCAIVATFSASLTIGDCLQPPFPMLPSTNPFRNISLPMLTYPGCDACSCEAQEVDASDVLAEFEEYGDSLQNGAMLPTSAAFQYQVTEAEPETPGGLTCNYTGEQEDIITAEVQSSLLSSGYDNRVKKGLYKNQIDLGGDKDEIEWYKSPAYPVADKYSNNNYKTRWKCGSQPTWSQALNLMNRRAMYFGDSSDGQGFDYTTSAIQIKTINDQFGNEGITQSTPFMDSCFIFLVRNNAEIEPATVFSFNNTDAIQDPNINKYPNGNQFGNEALTGTTDSNINSYVDKTITYIGRNQTTQTATAKLVVTGSSASYNFKSGVEYFQSITAMTVNEIISLKNNNSYGILQKFITNYVQRYTCAEQDNDPGDEGKEMFPLRYLPDWGNTKVVFAVRGVDVYTPKQKIKYDLSKLFGWNLAGNGVNDFSSNVVVEGEYFMNIPIQPNSPTTTSGQNFWRVDEKTPTPHHRRNNGINMGWIQSTNEDDYVFNQRALHHPSYTFNIDSTEWSQFSTTSFSNYVSLDKQLQYDLSDNVFGYSNGVNCPDNNWPNEGINPYPQSRIEGCGFQYSKDNENNREIETKQDVITVSPIYHGIGNGGGAQTFMTNSQNVVFRSDRIPSGDEYDYLNTSVFPEFRRYGLHLNLRQTFYTYSDDGDVTSSPENPIILSDDDSGDQTDITEDMNGTLSGVLSSFDCEGMVPFICYTGSGTNFGVAPIEECEGGTLNLVPPDRRVVGGCYNFVVRWPILSIIEDWKYVLEWSNRLKVMYALCQGIMGESFQNNWLNGTLYMPAFQRKTLYIGPGQENGNQVERYQYCGDPQAGSPFRRNQGPLYFNNDTNSFYYRCTPWSESSDEFIGQTQRKESPGANKKNIWFPTTIMEMGPRDEFAKELSLSGDFEGYIVDEIPSTTYKDTAGVTLLYVVSRIANQNILQLIGSVGSLSGTKVFFTRTDNPNYDGRADGDFVQLLSINSEFGVVPYIDGNYPDSITLGEDDNGNSIVGIFFSADTNSRRIITDGTKVLTLDPEGPATTFGYEKSQEVPYYMWNITDVDGNPPVNLFGTEKNNWETTQIYSSIYQSDDFFNQTQKYVQPNQGYGLGYIFNKDNNNPELDSSPINQFNNSRYKVGNPFFFYFGLKRGKTAMNRFIKKYIFSDLNG